MLGTACHAVMFKNDCAEEVVQLGDAQRWGPAPQPSAAAPCRAVAGVRDKLCRRREVRQEELLVAGSADELSLQIPDAYKQRFHARSESSVRLEGRSSRGDSGIPWVLRVSEGHVACNPAGIALVKQNRAAQTLVSWVAQDRLYEFSLAVLSGFLQRAMGRRQPLAELALCLPNAFSTRCSAGALQCGQQCD